MSLFWKREKEVRLRLDEYFAAADDALGEFATAMRCYLAEGSNEAFAEAKRRLHAAESRADDLRIDVEKTMYRRMLLPESRGDILGLLEAFDQMPNIADLVTTLILRQRMVIPDRWHEPFGRLVELNTDAYRAVRQCVDALFSRPDAVEPMVQAVDSLESASDKVEWQIITELFESDIDKVDMLMLREIVRLVSDISDSAARVARRMEIIGLKRRI